jgi:protein-L-isoaspartate(D-aspartate) O-methyltransferase
MRTTCEGPMTVESIETIRTRFADSICASIEPFPNAVRDAFALVPRENFLSPGPWQILTRQGYCETADANAAQVYLNAAIALDPDKGINNGEPQLHARMLAAAAPKAGETVVHVGAGAGYYTAILAELVGARGVVKAYEIVESVGLMAKSNLAPRKNVEVEIVSGTDAVTEADVIYVCAGATLPATVWLDSLRPEGRLVFPLTPESGFGGVLCLTRKSGDEQVLDARFVSPTMFIACEGARTVSEGQALSSAFQERSMMDVRSLRRNGPPDESSWFSWSEELWLSTKAA